MANMKVACAIAVMCIVMMVKSEAAISCGQVTSFLAPCISYVQGGPGPSGPCCAGVKRLNSAAASTPDRQSACNCLKTAANALRLNAANAAALPGKCGVNLPFRFSTSTNCASIRN